LRAIEQDVNNVFSAASDSNVSALKAKFEGVCEQIEELAQDTSKKLTDDTSTATSRLTQASQSSNEALKKKCADVKERVQMDMQAFVGRMNGKVSETELVRAQLEEAKSRVINEIRSELIAIRNGFETKLGELMKDAVASLTNVGAEVDSEMKGAYERSLSKIVADSQSAKIEIEESTTKLVRLINDQKAAALNEIAHAAGAPD
jgi:DNA anti-recombination protein RmuC